MIVDTVAVADAYRDHEDTWGPRHEAIIVDRVLEEMSELQKALLKLRREGPRDQMPSVVTVRGKLWFRDSKGYWGPAGNSDDYCGADLDALCNRVVRIERELTERSAKYERLLSTLPSDE